MGTVAIISVRCVRAGASCANFGYKGASLCTKERANAPITTIPWMRLLKLRQFIRYVWFDVGDVSVKSFQSHWYLKGITAAKLQWRLSYMNGIFNSFNEKRHVSQLDRIQVDFMHDISKNHNSR